MAETVEKRSAGRAIAIPMIGLGAACCCAIEVVSSRWPEYAVLPGAAGSILALCGLVLLFRSQLQAARAEAEKRADCIRISPYIPQMADGSNGAEFLKVVLAPAPEPIQMRPRRERPALALAHSADAAHLEQLGSDEDSAAERDRVERSRAAIELVSSLRLGTEWSRDLQLSRRAEARLDSDPFVQRLARLG